MVWANKENARKQNAMENPGMGIRGNTKEWKAHNKLDIWMK